MQQLHSNEEKRQFRHNVVGSFSICDIVFFLIVSVIKFLQKIFDLFIYFFLYDGTESSLDSIEGTPHTSETNRQRQVLRKIIN